MDHLTPRDREREAGSTSLPATTRTARPARALTAAATITGVLRSEIVSLHFPPGMLLSEKDLTERFGVSRTPLREALIRLAEEGLIDIRPQSGTSVARIPLSAIPEAVIVRQALEGTLVERAAAHGSAAASDRLNRVIDRQVAFASIGDQEAFHEADEAFHESIADLAGHPGIWRTVKQAKLQIDRCRRLTLPVLGRMNQVVAEHRVIAAAIRAGSVEEARSAMQTHLSAVLPDARLLATTHPDYFA